MNTLIWRVTDARYSDTAFSGRGAELWGGRWNSPGYPVVYAASNLSLAILETLVHTRLEDLPDTKLVAFSIELPEPVTVETLTVVQLPSDWQAAFCPALCDIGDRWFTAATTAALQVPSAIVPQETNYLLNPNHADFAQLVIGQPEPISLDKRLWE